MIIIDTNVVSELLKERPNGHVLAWRQSVSPGETWLTAITRGEIRYGIARLPVGRRRSRIDRAATRQLELAAERTLAYDVRAADVYGDVVAERERSGRPISHQDAQIAAIARVHRAAVATRNVSDFENTGIRVINPFDPSAW